MAFIDIQIFCPSFLTALSSHKARRCFLCEGLILDMVNLRKLSKLL